jgi:NAD(P)-dependent dehydrogenase (short-subunit alcohol dehydrogenase family)
VIVVDIKDCGYAQTPMTEISQREPTNTKIFQDIAASTPVGGKAAQPEEIAYAINFLLSRTPGLFVEFCFSFMAVKTPCCARI